MNSEEAYAIWAPFGSPWSPWVKPILFASEPDWDGARDPELPVIADPSWMSEARSVSGYRERASTSTDVATAFVVDLPGPDGVAWGIALARKGFSPVPLYNALSGGIAHAPMVIAPAPVASPNPFAPPPVASPDPFAPPLAFAPLNRSALVDVAGIMGAMRRATISLAELALKPDRAPAFLLDANRRFGEGVPSPGRFDNRSISLPTDFPSAVFLRSRGIARVVLIQAAATEPQEDLAHTLLSWQEGGIEIVSKSLAIEGAPALIQVTRPSWFRAVFHRFLATMGLRRNPLGGFGGTIPVPSAG